MGTTMQAANQGVHEDLILEATSPAGGRNDIRDPGHVFDTPGKNDIGHAGLDHGHSGDGCFHARNAHTVDGYGGNSVGYTGQ